jgi:hypothetical protein
VKDLRFARTAKKQKQILRFAQDDEAVQDNEVAGQVS